MGERAGFFRADGRDAFVTNGGDIPVTGVEQLLLDALRTARDDLEATRDERQQLFDTIDLVSTFATRPTRDVAHLPGSVLDLMRRSLALVRP